MQDAKHKMKRFKNTFYRGILFVLMGVAWAAQTTAFSLKDIDSVRARIEDWRQAWETRDIDRFSAFYSPLFQSNGLDRTEWTTRKARLFKNSGPISLKLENLSVFIEGDRASVQFIQYYQSASRSDVGEKSMILARADETWRIVSENWRPLNPPPDSHNRPSPASESPGPPVDRTHTEPPEDLPVDDILTAFGAGDIRIGYRADNGLEQVSIGLNDFSIPKFFTIEGERPRIVIDIKPVPDWQGAAKRSINGQHIRQIRTFLHKTEKRLRVVLDLYPDRDYVIEQIYDMTANVYTIGVEDVR